MQRADADSLPMIRRSQQGVNYHDWDIRKILGEIGKKDVAPCSPDHIICIGLGSGLCNGPGASDRPCRRIMRSV